MIIRIFIRVDTILGLIQLLFFIKFSILVGTFLRLVKLWFFFKFMECVVRDGID